MKIKFVALSAVLLLVLLSAQAGAEEFNPVPFAVKIGGKEAKAVAGKEYGQVAEAVAADAELEVGVKDNNMVICNIFPTNADGSLKAGGTPAILILQKASKTPLNKTMDSKALAAGTYRINIVGDGKTAIVNFTVK